MNKRLYLKTFLYMTLSFLVITSTLFFWFSFALPQEPFLPMMVAMSISFLLFMIMFTISFTKYSPVFQAAQKNANLNRILLELMHESVHATNKDELYKLILESAIQAIPTAQKGCILLLTPSTNMLQFTTAVGYDLDILKHTYLRLDQTYLYRESKGKIEHTVVIDDPFGYDRTNLHDDNINAILEAGTDSVFTTLSTPVIFNDKLHGMINIDSMFHDAYSIEDQRIIEIFALEIVNVIKLYSSIEKVNYYINHDNLTNTYNRKHFNELLESKLLKSTKNSTRLSLISLELSNLKITNAEQGHDCGDKLLVEFAYGIKKFLKPDYYFSRYSGDEFQLLIESTTLAECHQLINDFEVYFLAHPLKFKTYSLPITFSYGIVTYPEDQQTFKGLLTLADKRLYEHKQAYHNIS